MSTLHPAEEVYLRHMQDVDLGLIGREIGKGAQHIVRAYRDDAVIKYPRALTRSDLLSRTVSPLITQPVPRMQRDRLLAADYFGEYLLPYKLHTDADQVRYSIIQPYASLRSLTPTEVETHPALRAQLAEIAESNRRLLEDHDVWFDMMGWEGNRFMRGEAYLSNVAVTDGPDGSSMLRIHDCTLISAPERSFVGGYNRVLLEVQRLNMRRFGVAFV